MNLLTKLHQMYEASDNDNSKLFLRVLISHAKNESIESVKTFLLLSSILLQGVSLDPKFEAACDRIKAELVPYAEGDLR